jgi:hypothetical protein
MLNNVASCGRQRMSAPNATTASRYRGSRRFEWSMADFKAV